MKTSHLPSARRERGASLMIALVFLVIMAMLGVTVANVTMLQERMAGNTRDRDLALQAGQAALRDAESDSPRTRPFGRRARFVRTNANDDAFWETCLAATGSPAPSSTRPRRRCPTRRPGASSLNPNTSSKRMPARRYAQIYRVTARAVGGPSRRSSSCRPSYGFNRRPLISNSRVVLCGRHSVH